jgi:hypothetical protein
MLVGKAVRRWSFSRGRFVPGVTLLIGAWCLAAGCGGADDRPATWSFISSAIIEPSCATANCHSALAARASVDLSDRQIGYTDLTTRQFVITAAAAPSLTGDERAARSPAVLLMRAIGNLRMPPDLPLPEVDIQLFESWIKAGAANN